HKRDVERHAEDVFQAADRRALDEHQLIAALEASVPPALLAQHRLTIQNDDMRRTEAMTRRKARNRVAPLYLQHLWLSGCKRGQAHGVRRPAPTRRARGGSLHSQPPTHS